MAPGIFRLPTVCCPLIVPVRLAICLPLLICTLDAYSPPGALFPSPPQAPDIVGSTLPFPLPLPLILNITRPAPLAPGPASGSSNLSPEDARSILEYEYFALRPVPPPSGTHLGRALTLSFVIAAAALSILSLIAFRWFGGPGGDEDDATIVEGDDDSDGRAGRRLHLAALFLGTATRLLLGALGTTAMARVIVERLTIKQGSFIAVEVLGWLLV
jgi:hypothetical protein